jgi:dienelactone hydrolase
LFPVAERNLMTDRTLTGFDVSTFTHDARRHDVYRAGSGQAVIVIHELPGIYPGMIEFARRFIGESYRV